VLDDDFVNTWYDIRAQVVDNVLESTVFTLALKEHGCLQSQAGGTYGWTDTPGYGTKSTQRFQEGSTLTQEVQQLDTMATLNWRYFCVDVNRSLIEDGKNMGKYKIKSYIARRLEAARDALVQDGETYLMQWGGYYAAPNQMNGIYDIVAPSTAVTTSGGGSSSDSYASGTSNGNINRTNTWWRNWVAYDDATETLASKIAGATNEPYALNLVPDMEHFYNCVTAQQEPPNFIITLQDIYEAYGDEARDKLQIVRTAFNRKAADLGFETQTFRGAIMTYSTKISSNHVIMLNLNHIKWNYHPDIWFEMTNWKETANQFERVAYIVCMTPGLATAQPRRHGVMLYAS
jgi:hypothetical protein